ncbi:MAG: peptidylprolyl isomerase [bacterium]|nr:peptidylprolyl isomerase [Candidatus Kapabacteria bacterium]
MIATDSGDVEVELFGDDAPRTVKNFVGLSEKGFYNGIAFHRVIPGFVAQAGDPFSRDSTKRAVWGQNGESIYGPTFDDELDTNKPSAKLGYRDGILAMANRGPNTNSSQFFIVLNDAAAAQLTYAYTIFGRVRSGNEAVRKIESSGFQGEVPLIPARIKKVSVKAL